MRPGRELDSAIAQKIMGYTIKVKQKALWEETPLGERPLRNYSRDISAAWEVVEKMNITLIPIQENQWFALVGRDEAWSSPAAFIQYLQAGEFAKSGAAVGEIPALTICLAAIKAIEHRESLEDLAQSEELPLEATAESELKH